MKKRNIMIISCLTATAIAVASFFFINNKNENENDNPMVEIEEFEELPKLTEIDFNKNPMIYDFVNSSLSYKMDLDVSDYGIFYAILQNKNNPENIYVEYYTHGEALTFPSIGTEPQKLELNENEINAINDFSNKISENRKFKEGNWEMYIISQYNDGLDTEFNYCDNVGRWAGIDMLQFTTAKSGLMNETIKSGLGWPTEWLRKQPYIETMKNEGFDMNDTFWDKYNINSYKNYKRNNGSDDTLKVEVVQLDRFKFKIDGNHIYLNENQLQQYLKEEGWE